MNVAPSRSKPPEITRIRIASLITCGVSVTLFFLFRILHDRFPREPIFKFVFDYFLWPLAVLPATLAKSARGKTKPKMQILDVALHELGHVIGAMCCCGYPISITIRSDESGVTLCKRGIDSVRLFAGYSAQSLMGGLLLFCSFNTTASIVASAIHTTCLAAVLCFSSRSSDKSTSVVIGGGALIFIVLTCVVHFKPYLRLILVSFTPSSIHGHYD